METCRGVRFQEDIAGKMLMRRELRVRLETLSWKEVTHIGLGTSLGLGTLAVGDPWQGRSTSKGLQPLEDPR